IPERTVQDEPRSFAALSAGRLPKVSFIKPIGSRNEHPGYAGLLTGQQHVASLVHAIQNSPEWAHTLIIVTYDENGGFWDHVSPPNTYEEGGPRDRLPPGVISPFLEHGFVHHEAHHTLSILY